VNECLNGENNCSSNALCTNTPSSYICACNDGYDGDGVNCTGELQFILILCIYLFIHSFFGISKKSTDNDECSNSNGDCDEQATCTNTIGSFTCKCKTGYSGDGFNCYGILYCFHFSFFLFHSFFLKKNKDINECSTNNGGCSSNAKCTNTPGSFSCACKTGYNGNGTTCNGDDFLFIY